MRPQVREQYIYPNNLVEVLLKEPVEYQYKDYKNLEKVDVLALLIASKKDGGREELKTLMASYQDASNFVRVHQPQIIKYTRSFLEFSRLEARLSLFQILLL